MQSSSFRQYTPAELKALNEKIESANMGIEGQRGGVEIRKKLQVKHVKEGIDMMKGVAPELFQKQAAPIYNIYQQPEYEQPAIKQEEEEGEGEEPMNIQMGPAEDLTEEEYEGLTNAGKAAKWKRDNTKAEVADSVMEALNIKSITKLDTAISIMTKGNTEPYLFTDSVKPENIDTIIDMLEGRTYNGKTGIPAIRKITNTLKEEDRDRFPVFVMVKGQFMLFKHPADTFGSKSDPDNAYYVDWKTVKRGKGLRSTLSNTFKIDNNGAFGSALIDTIDLQLNNKLNATIDGQTVFDEKVSNGVKNLFLSPIYSKKLTKTDDVYQFTNLLQLFEYKPSAKVKKTAKYRTIADLVGDSFEIDLGDEESEEELEEDEDDLLTTVNRNLEAMQAGNRSATLIRQTFDALEQLVAMGELTEDMQDDYVSRIVAFVQL